MALSDCAECGHRVSSGALICPKCGHPIRQDTVAVADPNDPHADDPETRGEPAIGSAEPSQGDWWSRRPTWLLFVFVFIGGSVVLVAGVVAAAIVFGSIFDSSGNSNTAGDSTTTSTATSTTVPAGGDSGLSVGECIDDDELDRYVSGEDFSVMACDDPHDYEAYYFHEFAPGPYPGDEAVVDELYEACRNEFEGYVGRDYETSALATYRVWPGQGVWESGHRLGDCLLYDADSNKLTGSAYQSGW